MRSSTVIVFNLATDRRTSFCVVRLYYHAYFACYTLYPIMITLLSLVLSVMGSHCDKLLRRLQH